MDDSEASIFCSACVDALVACSPDAISCSMSSRVHAGKKSYGAICEISKISGSSNVVSSTVASNL